MIEKVGNVSKKFNNGLPNELIKREDTIPDLIEKEDPVQDQTESADESD